MYIYIKSCLFIAREKLLLSVEYKKGEMLSIHSLFKIWNNIIVLMMFLSIIDL